jgi:hypothetical protein
MIDLEFETIGNLELGNDIVSLLCDYFDYPVHSKHYEKSCFFIKFFKNNTNASVMSSPIARSDTKSPCLWKYTIKSKVSEDTLDAAEQDEAILLNEFLIKDLESLS